MSKTETPTPTATKTFKKTYKYFDLETFDSKEEEREISFTPASSLEEANERIGGSGDIMLIALNAYLQRQTLQKVENEVATKGGRKSIVMAMAKPLRAMPPFSLIKDRAAQTKAILDMIRTVPAMVDSIRQASIAAAAAGEDESEENEVDE